MLDSSQPMFVAWGAERTTLYNDAYSQILASKHPAALGRDLLDVWDEVRNDLTPIVASAYAGRAVQMDDITLLMERNGDVEETHFSFSYTPVRDEGGAVAGFFCACVETTGQVLAERRQSFRLELNERLSSLTNPQDAIAQAVALLGRHLGANRAGYGEVQADDATIILHSGYADGVSMLSGAFPLESFGTANIARQRQGATQVAPDVAADPDQDRSVWAAIDTRAFASVPLVRDGRLIASLYVNFREPHRWTADEIALIEEVAARTWAAVEGARAAARLRDSEARLRLALEASRLAEVTFHLPDGIAHSRPLAELWGHPPDKRLTLAEFRDQYHPDDRDRVLAQRDAILAGDQDFYEVEKRIVRPDGQVRWIYGRGSVTRDAQGRAISVTAVYLDQSQRKQAEAALRESEARLAFLDALGAATAPLADADAVLATTTRLLGEHLNLSVCAYADMDPDQDGFTIRGDWAAPGATSIVGHYSLADFGTLAVNNLGSGQPLILNDNLRELAPHEAATFQSIGIAATICMPLVKQGRLTALMAIHDNVPRVWTEAELSLLREVTARSWAHVERVGAIAELRTSEARFRLMADAVPQIVWITDAHGRVEFFNRQWAEYIGTPDVPTTAGDVTAGHVHPDDADRTMTSFEQARRTGGVFEVEHRIRRKDGAYRWFLVRAEPYRDTATGDIVRWFGASTDIHDHKLAEEALRDLNETLESRVAELAADRDQLWRLSRDPFVVCDMEGRWLSASPAWTEILGWTQAELVGRTSEWMEHSDDAERRRTQMTALAAGEVTRTFTNRFRDRAGHHHWFSWSAVAEGDRLFCVARDVTAEKDREAELAAAQEALRQSQKLEAMGQLTGGVAHDFNNLLTPIVGSLDMLQRKGLGGEREQRLIAGAIQSADRAKTLVQRLLAFARRQPLQPTAVDVGTLVAGMADLLASTTGPQIKLVVDTAENLPPAMADPNQLEMALLNLGVNARDAMPDGGTLRISASVASGGKDHRAGLTPGRYLLLSVADTGVGMDEATVRRAVEPFFSTKGVGKGTGLGLSMVHGLASQLGGAVTIQSRPGIGTNVELWLPASAEPVQSAAPAQDDVDVLAAVGTVLLVDDEELVRASTADMLGDLGYAVVEAGSAEEALHLLHDGLSPDLLITDHLMPGMNGTDLARTVRAERPSIKILIVSGYADTDGIAPDLPRLVKPFRSADLAASLAA
jgi:PAS domain S-box-containing protein